MPKIVISYRRVDSAAIAGRIRDRLVGHYGNASIFMDVEDIPLGTDFRAQIREVLLQGDALIAVIGPDWLGATKGGADRIQNESDPVRIEIETALKGGIRLIPVLVNNAQMPDAANLPDSLKDFAFLNAAEVDNGRDFHQHLDRLIQGLDILIAKRSGKAAAAGAIPPAPAGAPVTGRAAPQQSRIWIPIAAGVAALAAGVGVVLFLRTPPAPAVANAPQPPIAAQQPRSTPPPVAQEAQQAKPPSQPALAPPSAEAVEAIVSASRSASTNPNADALKRVDQCIRDNKDEPGGTPPIVRAYCACMSEKMDSNETRSITQWETSHPGEQKACEKKAAWK